MENAWNRGYVAAAFGALGGALLAGWVGIQVGEVIAGRRFGSEEFDLVSGLFDLIELVLVIGLVTLVFGAAGVVFGVWIGLRLGKFELAGRSMVLAAIVAVPTVFIVLPAVFSIAELADAPSGLILMVIVVLPVLIGLTARWITLKASEPNPTV